MSYNELNPVTSSLLVSGDMRANFLAIRRHMFPASLLMDPLFECWPDTDATPMSTWTLFGTGVAISRELGAPDRVVGAMSTRVTFGSDPAGVSQDILDATSYDPYFDGRTVTAGCSLKTATAAIGRIRIDDGVTVTNSAFHTGGGTFEYLDVEHLVDPSATKLTIELRVEGAGNVIFSGPIFLFSDIKPDRFVMPPMARSTLLHSRKSEIFTGEVDRFLPQRPFIVEHVQLSMTTSPVGADAIVDVNQYDGTVFTSLFTAGGRPRVLDSAAVPTGGSAPDGTYNRRCFGGYFGAGALIAGDQIQTEIDQVGIGTVGDDMNVHVRYKTWLRPQEIFAAFNMIG